MTIVPRAVLSCLISISRCRVVATLVLKLMHRHYDRQLFADKIYKVKTLMPDAFIGVDVMVGCRGETPECFEETYDFLNALDVTQLHVFPYSERPGTSALKIDYVVAEKEKKLRSKRCWNCLTKKTHDFYAAHVGSWPRCFLRKPRVARRCMGSLRTISVWNCHLPMPVLSMTTS